MSGIWVVLEERAGKVSRMSWEAAAAAQALGTLTGQAVNAVTPGAVTEAIAGEAAAKAFAKVVRVEHALLAAYTADGFTRSLYEFVRTVEPAYVVFPHTYQVRDFAPALAARFGQSLIGDVNGLSEGPTFARQLMQGKFQGAYKHAGAGPCFVSVQSGAFRAEGLAEGSATVEIAADTLRYRFGTGVTDFLICGQCGVYVGAVSDVGGRTYVTLNLNAFDDPHPELAAMPVSYEGEARGDRLGRRAARWTPARIVGG